MNRQANDVLSNIRIYLEAEENAVAYGPGSPQSVGDAATDAEAGPGGATNPSDASDTLDFYLTGIADTVALEYGKSPQEAMSFVFSAASALSSQGLVPSIPSNKAPPAEISVWLGKAASVQFGTHVMCRARDMAKS